MIEHNFYIKIGEEKSLVMLRLPANRNEFLTETLALSGVDLTSHRNKGVSFQLENSQTTEKQSIIMVNLELADIETVQHEMLHAMHWAHSDSKGVFTLNTVDEADEEGFLTLYEDLTRHVVRFIEQRKGVRIPFIFEEVEAGVDKDYESPMPDEVKVALDE